MPTIPSTTNMTPVEKNMTEIKLAHPITEYPSNTDFNIIQAVEINELNDKSIPRLMANFNGLSEKERIIS